LIKNLKADIFKSDHAAGTNYYQAIGQNGLDLLHFATEGEVLY